MKRRRRGRRRKEEEEEEEEQQEVQPLHLELPVFSSIFPSQTYLTCYDSQGTLTGTGTMLLALQNSEANKSLYFMQPWAFCYSNRKQTSCIK